MEEEGEKESEEEDKEEVEEREKKELVTVLLIVAPPGYPIGIFQSFAMHWIPKYVK